MAVSVCPSEATLRAFPGLNADDPDYSALEGHIQECPHCLAVLERLVDRQTTAASRGGTHGAPRPEGLPEVPGLVVGAELGRGGMGVVYLAWHPLLQRHVALKLVAGGPLAGDRERKRWLREARAHARVKHRHVAQVHDVVETDEWLVLVLEYVPGGTLESRLGGRPLAPRDAARLLQTIAEAVEAIHQQGLRHLDLKPSNILLDSAPDAPWEAVAPKVSDFGIARLHGEPAATTNTSGGLRGTPSYMAPEQVTLRPGELGPGADVYALGAMLYTLLTGRPPFQAPTAVEILDMVRREDPVSPRRLIPRIPRDLETICMKCLQKDPARRYASAETLGADLDRWLEGRPIAARAVSPIERAWRMCRRRPAVSLLLFTLVLTVGLSLVVLSALLGRAVVAKNQADSARDRARDNQQLASQTLREIATFIANSHPEYDLTQRDRLDSFVQYIRQQLREPARRAEVDTELLASLAILEQRLVNAFPETHEREAEAGELVAESVSLLRECLRRQPRNQGVIEQLTESLIISARVAVQAGRFEQGLGFLEEATASVLSLESAAARLNRLQNLSSFRRHHSFRALWLGRPEAARRALEADLRMFETLTEADQARAQTRLLKALTLARLRPQENETPLVRSALSDVDSGFGLFANRNEYVAEWLTTKLERALFDEAVDADSASTEARDSWANLLIDATREGCVVVREDESLVPLAGYRLSCWVQIGSAALRHTERTANARRIERRFAAFARQLVRRYPDRVESYMTLSEAFTQSFKNSIREHDEEQAVAALHCAHDAASKAASLAPGRADVRRIVDKHEQRLARYGQKP